MKTSIQQERTLISADLTNGFGASSYLFGAYGEGAVSLGEKDSQREDKFKIEVSINEDSLKPNDWVAIEERYNGQIYNSTGGKIRVLAHKLPLLEAPEEWKPISGSKEFFRPNRTGERVVWTILSDKTGKEIALELVVKQLGLQEISHPFGKLYMDGETPVMMNEEPRWSGGDHSNFFTNKFFLGDINYFHEKGFAIYAEEEVFDYDGFVSLYQSSSKEILLQEQELSNLQQDNWYPVQIEENYVIWATGLELLPDEKKFLWKSRFDSASSDIGSRIFDSSRKRLERVKQFFEENIGAQNNKLSAYEVLADKYEVLADEWDPHNGVWEDFSDFPNKNWKPEFSGWSINQFPGLECRWKQGVKGGPRYYGVCR